MRYLWYGLIFLAAWVLVYLGLLFGAAHAEIPTFPCLKCDYVFECVRDTAKSKPTWICRMVAERMQADIPPIPIAPHAVK